MELQDSKKPSTTSGTARLEPPVAASSRSLQVKQLGTDSAECKDAVSTWSAVLRITSNVEAATARAQSLRAAPPRIFNASWNDSNQFTARLSLVLPPPALVQQMAFPEPATSEGGAASCIITNVSPFTLNQSRDRAPNARLENFRTFEQMQRPRIQTTSGLQRNSMHKHGSRVQAPHGTANVSNAPVAAPNDSSCDCLAESSRSCDSASPGSSGTSTVLEGAHESSLQAAGDREAPTPAQRPLSTVVSQSMAQEAFSGRRGGGSSGGCRHVGCRSVHDTTRWHQESRDRLAAHTRCWRDFGSKGLCDYCRQRQLVLTEILERHTAASKLEALESGIMGGSRSQQPLDRRLAPGTLLDFGAPLQRKRRRSSLYAEALPLQLAAPSGEEGGAAAVLALPSAVPGAPYRSMRAGLWVCPHLGCSSSYSDVVAAHNHAIDHRREQHWRCWSTYGVQSQCLWCSRWGSQLCKGGAASPYARSSSAAGGGVQRPPLSQLLLTDDGCEAAPSLPQEEEDEEDAEQQQQQHEEGAGATVSV